MDEYAEIQNLSLKGFRDLLHTLMKDPLLWDKMSLLESDKYTKTYQADGLDLVAVKFYPFPEDWCELSALSNGSGFSRCYIFVYLLEYYLGKRKFTLGVTNPRKIKRYTKYSIKCQLKVGRQQHYLERKLKKAKKTPTLINLIQLNPPDSSIQTEISQDIANSQ